MVRPVKITKRSKVVNQIPLALQPGSETPLFVQITRSVVRDIQRGRLLSGSKMPSSRQLAQSLGVHRNTVIAAYDELFAEGWLVTQPARGTFVADSLPVIARTQPEKSSTVRKLKTDSPLLILSGGVPDTRLLPRVEWARTLRRIMMRANHQHFSYGDPQGLKSLRAALASHLRQTRGLAIGPEHVLITSGSQMACHLLSLLLLGPGKAIGVEELGYQAAWQAFARTGAKLIPLAIDKNGLDTAKLSRLRRPLAALYVTPHHQYPTMATLSAKRRLELLELAAHRRFWIIEDDYDHEFHYEGRPILPLGSISLENVVYVGSLSKVLMPALRLGYIVAQPELIKRLTELRFAVDRQPNTLMELATCELLEEGAIARHIWRSRRVYQQRRDQMGELLREAFGESLDFSLPCGGLALWVHLNKGPASRRDALVDRWVAQVLQMGIEIRSESQFAFRPRAQSAVRIGFANCNQAEMQKAVQKLSAAWRAANAS